ncbi:MAG: TIGR02302 family protein, partial [Alphaproteobacteria bacterium]|nr:TIGR02302 family protein [Alphaproteobacteria bacterium]
MTVSPRRRVEETIHRARLAEGLERLWAALLWPMVSASAATAFLLSGGLGLLPPWPRLVALIVLCAIFLVSLRGLLRLAWPDRPAAMRRVERRSDLAHRPVSGLDDRLASGRDDPHQQTLWEEHRLRQLESLGHIRAGAPLSFWRDLDRRALRLPAFLALLTSLLLGSGEPAATIAEAVRFSPAAPKADFALDAWLRPPAYTGRAPVVLTSPAMVEKLKAGGIVTVPENSVLSLRLAGAASPQLELLAGPEEVAPGLAPTLKSADGLFQAEVKMSREAVAVIRDGNRELARWPLKLIPDQNPTVDFAEPPSGDSSGMLSVKWKAGDDYGVTGVTAEIDLADDQEDGIGFASNGIFLYAAPAFPIVLNRAAPKDVKATARADMAEHPWAGFMVEMTLTARDAAGQTTKSAVQTFRLPERLFLKPLARALIEQRRALILAPEQQGKVEQMLDAMMTYPDGLFEGSGQYLAVAAIVARLRAAADRDDVDVAVNMLWQTAIGIEDGILSDIRAELEALRKELERAIEEGAPPERIAEITQRLREAMQRYLQSMADELARDPNRERGANALPPDARTVTPEELQRMLDRIEKLAKNGANDAARQLLSQLDDILRNLRPGMQSQNRQGGQPLAQMLDQLSDLMRQQQRLMDDTQRMLRPG